MKPPRAIGHPSWFKITHTTWTVSVPIVGVWCHRVLQGLECVSDQWKVCVCVCVCVSVETIPRNWICQNLPLHFRRIFHKGWCNGMQGSPFIGPSLHVKGSQVCVVYGTEKNSSSSSSGSSVDPPKQQLHEPWDVTRLHGLKVLTIRYVKRKVSCSTAELCCYLEHDSLNLMCMGSCARHLTCL
jgi:hypothetical protein